MSKAHKFAFVLYMIGIVSSALMFGAGIFFSAVVITELVSQEVSVTIHMQPATMNAYGFSALAALGIGLICGAVFISMFLSLRRTIYLTKITNVEYFKKDGE